MEVIESTSDGLKRELKVKIEAAELSRRLEEKLQEIKGNVRLKGFRPGKVPVDHLRKVYGRSMMAEIVQQTVAESSAKAVQDRDERPAVQPDISLGQDQQEIEKVMSGDADLSYTLSFEILPRIEITDLSKLKLERPVAKVAGEEVEKAIERIVEESVTYEDKDGAAEQGDQAVIDFEGSIDGVKFDGGAAEDAPVVIGRDQFIPGFEEGLIGVKAGDEREIKVTFPQDYPGAELAGKDAVFAVKVKSVGKPVKPAVDETFAKAVGFEGVDKLREGVESRIKEQYGRISRMRVKRELLDALDKTHQFDLPEILVKQEFDTIWRQITGELERAGKTFEDEGTTEEKEKKKYEELAERRVRLGLVLAEIGEKSDVKISDDEVNNALMERLRQFPGQEQQVYEFYQKNPQALAELRAPIFEEKVVDYILELAEVNDKTVTSEELIATAEEDDDDEDDL